MVASTNIGVMAVTLPRDVLFRYRRFSLYNSPYVAHDRGCAVDLYPVGEVVPSPVTGEILETRTVRAPPKPYAADRDHLLLVDTGSHVVRLLHVDPQVVVGETVEVGDPLGDPVRAGFFAPWVPDHVHLEFRSPDRNPYRASGSVPLELGIDVRALPWNGTGTVVAAGNTWARLDEPRHPAPGEAFAGLASGGGVLDGGFPHYEWGGLFGGGTAAIICDTAVGTVSGRDVAWHDCTVRANGEAVTGIALFCGRDAFGIKLVGEGMHLNVGDHVEVDIVCHDER